MNSSANSINWFDIPVTDLHRAKHFYQVIFSMHMEDQEISGMPMAVFPYNPGSGFVAGALVKNDMNRPGNDGVLIYLNANPSIQSVIEKIESEGGKIILPKTQITPEIGYMAIFDDTEGNRVGLHSQE